MLALDNADGQTPGQLATKLGVRPPTITSVAPTWDPHAAVLVSRLKAQGYFGGIKLCL